MATVDGQRKNEVVVRMKDFQCAGGDLHGETPLFAAGLQFARKTSGQVARAFLDSLPDEWKAGHLVIDSTLVWLPSGFRQGQMLWCHEPFPGRTDGVPGESNLNRNAEHIACCFGKTHIEFLEGAVAAAECDSGPLGMDEIRLRHTRLEAAIGDQRLTIHQVPANTMYRYRWGSFHRHAVAKTSGFHFWIRATRGDNRPLVNGIRNATNL
ncbi:hypothetical protein [Schlesneria sp. T3-172]|uniref:hypothetical protein n=1 Tax=Schlesneria sphaerica TaxID=3373610 RepID=UPI0037C6632E